MTRAEQALPAAELPFRKLVLAGCALIAALLAFAFTIGRDAQIAAQATERAEIAQDDRSLCADLGFKEPDAGHVRCLNGLADIRRKQKQRWDATIP